MPRIQFKKLTKYERELILRDVLNFENCNFHTCASLGFDYSLKVQNDDEPKCCCIPSSIQDLRKFYDVINYDFDRLLGTGILGYISDTGSEKQPISSLDNLNIVKQTVKHIYDKTSNKLLLSSFKIDEIQGLSFYIEAIDPVPVSLVNTYLDSNSYKREASSDLEDAFIRLESLAQLEKSAEKISSCDGIHPLAYAVLSYVRHYKTLPVNTKSDIELLWRYMVAKFDLTSVEENTIRTQDNVDFDRAVIWKQYDKTYCEKVFDELVELAKFGS